MAVFSWREVGKGAVELVAEPSMADTDKLCMQARWRVEEGNICAVYTFIRNRIPPGDCPLPFMEELYEGRELEIVRQCFPSLVRHEVDERLFAKRGLEAAAAWQQLIEAWPDYKGLIEAEMMKALTEQLLIASGHEKPPAF